MDYSAGLEPWINVYGCADMAITERILSVAQKITPEGSHASLSVIFDVFANWTETALLRKDALTPPLRIRLHIGPFGDARLYRTTAQRNLEGLRVLGGLSRDYRVLDLGCGCGRMAAVLTQYLSSKGSYEGLDTAQEPIYWCQREISPRFPRFHFLVADVRSQRYNPRGETSPSQFVFPYQDESFDFIFALSVFTHMLPEDVRNYVAEIGRVLKREGRCVATFYLLDRESTEFVNAGLSRPMFPYDCGGYRVADLKLPEFFVAHSEKSVRRFYADSGLRIFEPIGYASWCPRKNVSAQLSNYAFFQDVVVAMKGKSRSYVPPPK